MKTRETKYWMAVASADFALIAGEMSASVLHKEDKNHEKNSQAN